MKFLVKKKSNV